MHGSIMTCCRWACVCLSGGFSSVCLLCCLSVHKAFRACLYRNIHVLPVDLQPGTAGGKTLLTLQSTWIDLKYTTSCRQFLATHTQLVKPGYCRYTLFICRSQLARVTSLSNCQADLSVTGILPSALYR